MQVKYSPWLRASKATTRERGPGVHSKGLELYNRIDPSVPPVECYEIFLVQRPSTWLLLRKQSPSPM